MTTQQTSAAAIDWTTTKNGKTVPLYRPLELSPELAKEREAWLAAQNSANKLRDAMDAKIKASLAKGPFGQALPAGHDLVIVHRFGPAFAALPQRVKGAKVNAVKAA